MVGSPDSEQKKVNRKPRSVPDFYSRVQGKSTEKESAQDWLAQLQSLATHSKRAVRKGASGPYTQVAKVTMSAPPLLSTAAPYCKAQAGARSLESIAT